jgi:hypothetical protein
VRPAVVVDPFGGTGTAALVASVLGRTVITIDRSGDYCRLAAWRARVLALRAHPAAHPAALHVMDVHPVHPVVMPRRSATEPPRKAGRPTRNGTRG